ncbi:MAG: PEP-CTERM sorting domain-containing protein [Phycisphaerae bacterium]|nr:PEP-CTERM sorting domain-containing protein [Phycisphaerae bacterium]
MNRTLLLTTLFVIFAVSATHADIIQIAIQARVSQVDDPANLLEGNIASNDLITGTYTYNSDTSDTNPDPDIGSYWHYSPPYGINLSGDGYNFQSDPTDIEFLVGLGNDRYVEEEDYYIIRSRNNLSLSNGVGIEHISWQLDDPTGNAISSIDLPVGPPLLSDWESIFGLYIQSDKFGLNDDSFLIIGHVESAVLVPEPGMICLLSFGVLGLMRRGKH